MLSLPPVRFSSRAREEFDAWLKDAKWVGRPYTTLDPTGRAAHACGRGLDAASFVVADEVENYPHAELREFPWKRRKPTGWAWIDVNVQSPPMDGTELVILANLISDYGGGEMDAQSICARVRWICGAWVDHEGLAIVPHPESQRLVILHFTPAPRGD